MEEIRLVRQRLDTHIVEEDKQFREIHRDISHIREDLRGYKVKLGGIMGGLSAAVAALVSWVSGIHPG